MSGSSHLRVTNGSSQQSEQHTRRDADAASRLRSVGQVDHTVLVRRTGRKRQVAGRGFLREEPWTGPAGERVDEQMQLVYQAVREHRSDQRAAAADVEVAVDLLLQAADRIGLVWPDDLRVPPRRSRERRGD